MKRRKHPEYERLLRERYPTGDLVALARELGTTVGALYVAASRLGLSRLVRQNHAACTRCGRESRKAVCPSCRRPMGPRAKRPRRKQAPVDRLESLAGRARLGLPLFEE